MGRDYHKVLKAKLNTLATQIQDRIGPLGYRVFTDSAPILEVRLAKEAGIGWRGKHTLLLTKDKGSWFYDCQLFCPWNRFGEHSHVKTFNIIRLNA